jgi:3-oxoacyl-[acyl-carrier-protein] synthase-3
MDVRGRNVGIIGTGAYLPAEKISNDLIAEWTGATEEWILRKTGVRHRWYAAGHEATSDLASAAARAALADAGVDAEQIRWIVVATCTPDHIMPPTACLVQQNIGATNAAAFDVNAVCSGFVVALATAAELLDPGRDDYALVIGADLYSRIIDRTDKRTAVLFGDGAGAVVLGPVPGGRGFVGADIRSHGDQSELIQVEAGGSRLPASDQTLAEGRHFFQMRGRAVSEYVADELPAAVRRVLAKYDVPAEEVDHFVPHQANGVMLRNLQPELGLPSARMHLTVADHGNTSGASVPLALDDARRSGLLNDGDLLLLAGFGSGMTVGTALLRWSHQKGNT